MKALDAMVRDVVTVSPDAKAKEAIKLLAEHDISALPVVDADGNVVGSSARATSSGARSWGPRSVARGGWKR